MNAGTRYTNIWYRLDCPLGKGDDHAEAVEVHATGNPLSANDYSEFCELVNSTVYFDSHRLDQYCLVVQFVADKVSHH